MGADQPAAVSSRQEERYGGIKVGSAFFGWTTAIGIAALPTWLLAATGVASVARDTTAATLNDQATTGTDTARTIGVVGAIALLVILFVLLLRRLRRRPHGPLQRHQTGSGRPAVGSSPPSPSRSCKVDEAGLVV